MRISTLFIFLGCLLTATYTFGQCPTLTPVTAPPVCGVQTTTNFRVTGSTNNNYTFFENPASGRSFNVVGGSVDYNNLFAPTTMWAAQQGCTNRVAIQRQINEPPRNVGENRCTNVSQFGLIAHWNFDNTLTSTNPPSYVLTHNGSPNPTFTADRNGNLNSAIRITPQTYLSHLNTTAFGDMSAQMTIACWSRTDNWLPESSAPFGLFNALVSKSFGSQTSFAFRMLMSPTSIIGSSEGWSRGFLVPFNFRTGVWYHTAITFDGSKFTYYVNGRAIGHVICTQPLRADNSDLEIGRDRSGPTKKMDGVIDEVYLFARALSPAEIRTLAADCEPLSVNMPATSICNGASASVTITNPEDSVRYQLVDSVGNALSPAVQNGLANTLTLNSFNNIRSQTVFVRASINGCSLTLSSSFRLTVGSTYDPTIVRDRYVYFCDSANSIYFDTTLNNPALNGYWTFPNGSRITTGFFTLQTGKYVLTLFNNNNCPTTDTLDIIRLNLATPIITASQPNPICGVRPITLTSNLATGNRWSTGDTTQSITVSREGTYTLRQSILGCLTRPESYSVVFIDNRPPQVVSSTGGNTVCPGDSLRLKISNLIPGAIYNWRVYRGSQIQQSFVADSVWGYEGLSYEVWANFGNGCTFSCTLCRRFNVVANPLPAVRTPSKLSVCANGPVGLIGSDSIPATGVTYTYRWANMPGQPTLNGNVQFSSFGGTNRQMNFRVVLQPTAVLPTTIYLIQRATVNATGCSAEDTTELTVLEAPLNFRIVGPTAVCDGLTTTLTAVADNDQANFRYQWSTGDTTRSITVSTAGTYSVVGASRLIQSCPVLATTTLTQLPFTYLPAGPDKTVCATDSIHDIGLSGATQMAVQYDQTFDTPLTPPADVEYRFTPSRRALVVFKVKPGHTRFPFKFAAIKAQRSLINGCFKNDTVWFTVNDAPTDLRILSPSLGICSGGALSLTANAIAYADTNFSYQWSTGQATKSITVTQPGTYRVTATLNGCSKTDSITIVPGDLNTVSAGQDATACAETSISFGDGQPANPVHSYQWSGLGTAQTNWLQQTNVRNPVLNAGLVFSGPADTTAKTVQYVLQARNLITACEKLDTVSITVNPPIRINAGQDDAICSGNAITLGTAAKVNYAYSWSPALGLSNPNVAQPVLTYENPTDTAQQLRYILTVTDNGCQKQDTVLITYQPKPRFEIVGIPSVCPGVQGVGYSAINSRNGQSFNWVSNAAILMNGQGTDSITVNWPNIRASRIALKAVSRSAFGCVSDTVSFNVRVLPTLEPQIPRGDTLLCQEELVQTYTIPRSPGSVYTWFANNGAIISAQGGPTVTVRWAGAREGYLQYRENVTADTICEGYSPVLTIRYSPKPDPQPILGLQSIYCGPQQINVRTNRTAGNSYIWKLINLAGRTIDSTITTDTTFRTSVAPVGRYVVSVVAWSPQGCYGDTNTSSFTIAPIPVANAGQNQRICAGGRVAVGVADNPALTYRWLSRTNLSDSTTAQPVFTAPVTQSQSYNLILEVTDRASGCQDLDTVTVAVDSLPAAPAIRRNQTICQSTIVRLADTVNLGLSYNWQPTTWLTDARSAAPRFNYPLQLQRDSTFKFYSTTTVPGTGCQRLDSVSVQIQARPNVQSAIGATLCADGSSQIGVVPQVNVAYQWSPAGYFDLPTAAQPQVRWSGRELVRDTTVNFKLVARNMAGCMDSISVPVLFRAQPLRVAGPDLELCEGQRITIGTRPVANYTYQWQAMRGLDQPGIYNPTFGLTDLSGVQDSVARAILLVTDNITGCQRLDTANITIRARARFDLVTTDTVVCSGPNLVFNAVNRQGSVPHNYTWYLNGRIVGGGNFLSLPVNNLTGFRERMTVKLEAIRTDVNNCMDERSVSIVILPNDSLSLNHNRRWVCPYRLTGHRYTVRSGWAKEFRWQIVGGAVAAQDSNGITVNWDQNASRYFLQVDAVTPDGCVTRSDTFTVKLDALANQPGSGCSIDDYPLMIPNVITPNNDGANDALVIDELALYPEGKLIVYDRYGKELMTYQPYRNQFDGSGYSAGTYYIHFDTGRGKVYKGWCQVMR